MAHCGNVEENQSSLFGSSLGHFYCLFITSVLKYKFDDIYYIPVQVYNKDFTFVNKSSCVLDWKDCEFMGEVWEKRIRHSVEVCVLIDTFIVGIYRLRAYLPFGDINIILYMLLSSWLVELDWAQQRYTPMKKVILTFLIILVIKAIFGRVLDGYGYVIQL